MKMGNKIFNRVFAPVNNDRMDKTVLNALALKTVFVCPVPMFDDIKDRSDLFEKYIHQEMSDFDPDNDFIADFGDSMIFAMMAFYVGRYYDYLYVARYNRRSGNYTIRLINGEDESWSTT